MDRASVKGSQKNYRFIFLLGMGLFFVFKLPLVFVSYNPEELRDFEHFVLTSQGLLPYKDFVWLYGPITPFLYGTLLKVLPVTLLTVRLISNFLWSLGAGALAVFLHQYFLNSRWAWFGLFFVTSMVGFPSYSNNHIFSSVSLLFCLLSLFKLDSSPNDRKWFFYSWLGLWATLFSRPVLMGYGALAVWLFWNISQIKISRRELLIRLGIAGATFLVTVLVCFALFGVRFRSSLLPEAWAILFRHGYVNLSYLVPKLKDIHNPSLFLKEIRGALETFLFYLHYFVWPTFIITYFSLFPMIPKNRAGFLAGMIGLGASLDLLHYGFFNPLTEQAMRIRGQYFGWFTFLSMFIVVHSFYKRASRQTTRVAIGVVATLLLSWSFFPYGSAIRDFSTYAFNAPSFSKIRFLLQHPGRIPTLQAIEFINQQCTGADKVVIAQYEPGLSQLLNCPDLFQQDAYAFTRMPWQWLEANETPLNLKRIQNGDLISQKIAAIRPRFFVIQDPWLWEKECDRLGLQKKRFGPESPDGRLVCYPGTSTALDLKTNRTVQHF